jgi:hypothetical protein
MRQCLTCALFLVHAFAGITRGQMQQWQAEVSKTAAMAALLASNAGWWQLETLLAPLSAQAAAGVRPELLPLMEVGCCSTQNHSCNHWCVVAAAHTALATSVYTLHAAISVHMPCVYPCESTQLRHG